MKKKILYIICILISAQQAGFAQSANSFGNPPTTIAAPRFYKWVTEKLPYSKEDSFCLRLWSTNMFGHYLATLRKNGAQWEAHKYAYYNAPWLNEDKIKPAIPLNSFIDSLQKINFNTLIPQYDVKDFDDNVEDGTVYTLEISTSGVYKALQYHSPELFADKEINNKHFLEVISLLNRYFHFYNGNDNAHWR